MRERLRTMRFLASRRGRYLKGRLGRTERFQVSRGSWRTRERIRENLGWERSVSRMCVDHYWSVEGEMSVKFCIGSPANVGVMAGRPEEFFIGTPTPGDPETPPRAALEDHWVMRCIGKPADETMGASDLRGLADHLGDIRLLIKAPVDESFVRGRVEEFFIGTPTPGTPRTPSIWQGAGETLTCDSLHGVRDSGCEMQLSSMSAEVSPVSSVFELLYRFVGIDPDSITTAVLGTLHMWRPK